MENIAAANIELSENDLTSIADTLARIEVQGDRYPAHLAARAGN